MRVLDVNVQSGKFFSFSFIGLKTDYIYYACLFEKTGMVVIFKTDENITKIDRWMTSEQFENLVTSNQIEIKIGSNNTIIYSEDEEASLLQSVLNRYTSRFPIVCN